MWALVGLAMAGVLVWAFFLRKMGPDDERAGSDAKPKPRPPARPLPGSVSGGPKAGMPNETNYNPRLALPAPLGPVFGFGFPRALTATLTRDEGIDILPSLACDGAGNWIAAWASSLPVADAPGQTDSLIYFSRAGDDGMWSAPQALNPDRAPKSRSGAITGGPTVATDGQGVWVVSWFTDDQLDGSVQDDDIVYVFSTDAGAAWSAPAPLNLNAREDSGADANPRLAADGRNNWVAVWESLDTLNGTIGEDRDLLVSTSTDGAATWSAPKPLNANAADDGEGADRNASIVTDRNGVWIAAWERIDKVNPDDDDEDLFFSRSMDAGFTWSAPERLNTNGGSDREMDSMPKLASDGQGAWIAVWYTKNDLTGKMGADADIAIARSEDNGATWSPPLPLHPQFEQDSRPDYSPQISTNGRGDWLVVWESLEPGQEKTGDDSDIWISRSRDRGRNWSAPAPLNTNAATDTQGDFAPVIANNNDAHWVVLWNSKEDIGGALGPDQDVIVTQSLNLDQAP